MPSSPASFRAAGEIRRRPDDSAAGANPGAVGAGPGTGPTAVGVTDAAGTAAGPAGTAPSAPSSWMTASTVPTGTFSPGWTRIRSITPLTKISMSIKPFSVSTSATISPRRT